MLFILRLLRLEMPAGIAALLGYKSLDLCLGGRRTLIEGDCHMPKPKFKRPELNRKINWNEKNIEGVKRDKLNLLRAELGANYECTMQRYSCSCCQALMQMAERFVPGFQVANKAGSKRESSYLNDRKIYLLCNFYEDPEFIFDDEWQEEFSAGKVKGQKPIKVVAKEQGMTPSEVKAAIDRYRNQMKKAGADIQSYP